MAKRGGMKRQHLAASKAENANDESEAPKSPKKRRLTIEEPTDFGTYLDTERLRGFKCPKKGDDAPNLESVSVMSRQSSQYTKEIKPILERSFKTQEFFQSFIVKECFILRNKQHEQEYTEKRTQLRQNVHTPKEMQKLNDHYGFVFAKNKNQIVEWCKEGICKGNASVSHLGESNSGVSLSQFVDLVCPTTLLPKEGWICIVKYFKGRAYYVSPNASPLEPQPNHDCHMTHSSSHFSSGRLKENDDVALSNQIFLFEYNEDAELIPRPRHVMPYAAVRYNFEMSVAAALQTRDTNDPKMNRLLLQKERMSQLNEAPGKTYLNNRQHPGVPLTEVKPRPPKLGCRTAQDLFTTGSLFGKSSKPRRTKEKAAEKAVKPPEPKRAKKKKEEATPSAPENAAEANPEPAAPPPLPQELPAARKKLRHIDGSPESVDRSERLAPNVGRSHFSGGFVVSVVRLKVGSKFQGKMDLVSYADKVVYPVAVLAPKLCVRRFLPMASLLANELSGVCVSLKDEFMLSDGIHFGSYYRFYLRPSTPSIIPLSNLMDYMRNRNKVAAVSFPTGNKEILMFPDCEFASAIGIPPLAKSSSTQSTIFLHCLLLSDAPRHNYYSCLREPIVPPDVQRVDEVLSSYIWADLDLPPVDEEAARLQGSYGGVWPCAEALTQLIGQMNEVQNKRFRHLLGKSTDRSEPLAYQALDFTREVRSRAVVGPEADLERISELISKKELQEVLANVELLEQQKNKRELQEALLNADPLGQKKKELNRNLSNVDLDHQQQQQQQKKKDANPEPGSSNDLELDPFEDETTERIGDWRNRRKDIHCGLGNIFRSIQETPSSPPPLVDCESQGVCEEALAGPNKEPEMVRYSKTVFEEPPSSPPHGGHPELDIKKETVDMQASVMTTQLARINAEMKELGSSGDPQAEGSDSTACFGKMLNVIRNSMYENKRSAKEGVEQVTSPPEPGGSFDGYDIQNRAAKAARERNIQEGEEDEDNGRGINDWYWDYYRRAVAQSGAPATEAAKQKHCLPVPSGWARRSSSPPSADINDDEIHRILDEGMEEEEKRSSTSSKSPTDTLSVGNFSSPVPTNRRDLRFLRRTPQAGVPPSKVVEDAMKEDDTRVTLPARKDDDVSLSIRKIEDARVLPAMQKDENANARVTLLLRKNKKPQVTVQKEGGTPPSLSQRITSSPSSRPDITVLARKAMASPSSSMSISSTDDADAEVEGSHIPVMVNRRFSGLPSPPRANGVVVPAVPTVFPPLSLVPLRVPVPIPVPGVPKEGAIFADQQVTRRAT